MDFGLFTLFVATLTLMASFGGGLFDVLVNEENLVRGFPDSITHVRNYWKYRNPGDFYKVLSPLFGLSALAATVWYWSDPAGRQWLVLGAIGCFALTQAITVIYFFPGNKILREAPVDEAVAMMQRSRKTRLYWDYFRQLLTLTGSVLLLSAIAKHG
ncbi:DUF1772 domain-containing protein [Fibrella aquatilis]|uniref:DUF1772 domain-containing protein n=1 Tax=Fibrella aquatilis TaxID=2817059 RepID=A0A939FZ97_9BACT|nr:DUF1772 domain-containing protein [Fibrella aquatilis]MBO0929487.1 DUF1772 domain-containing protein [Fibrella aquatilis]